MIRVRNTKLKKLGLFTLDEARKAGLDQPSLSRLVSQGAMQRVARGVYLHPEAKVDPETIDFQIARIKFGEASAIGGLSALFHYNLVDQVPGQTWVIVPPGVHTAERQYRLIRTKVDLQVGVVAHKGYRIASIERALIEALR